MSRSGRNEAHLMEALAAGSDLSRVGALEIIKAFTDVVTEDLLGEKESILPGLGILQVCTDAGASTRKTARVEVVFAPESTLEAVIAGTDDLPPEASGD